MLLVVRRDGHKLALINTDHLVQVTWVEDAGDHTTWSAQMTHGRELKIITAVSRIVTPATAAGTAIPPDKLLATLAGGLAS